MKHKHSFWITGYLVIVFSILGLIALKVIHVDPFFHYHKPHTDGYFYKLDNQRSQNNGIVKHFDYTGIITGTSMTENFKTSEAESLWGGSFIKVTFSGGTYKEINDNIAVAIDSNPDLETVIRGLDMLKFIEDKDKMRSDLGEFPTYLYDDNAFNDVEYIFNRNVIFNRVYPMTKDNDAPGFTPGITSFDDYSNWMGNYKFGKNVLFPEGITVKDLSKPVHLSEEETDIVKGTVKQNLTSLPEKFPDITFYYFFTPYSAQYWMESLEDGTIYKTIEAERIIIEELLKYSNIRLFSFNCRFDITTDLNNYKDSYHYAEWINSLILRNMFNGDSQLTKENYQPYLEKELEFYTTYDYNQLNDQLDYEDDYYAAYLLAEEAYGCKAQPIELSDKSVLLNNAVLLEDQYNGQNGILCTGKLDRDPNDKSISIGDYMHNTEYIGFKITVDDITPYRFISFYGKKIANHGHPTVCIYDTNGNVIYQMTKSYRDIDNEWSEYILNVTDLSGEVEIIFNGGFVSNTGNPESRYIFSNIQIY